MKSLEIKDTIENLIDTYQNDSIGRNTDIHNFISMLSCLDGNMTISLDGKWGSGKTFFVKQCKLILEAFNSTTEFSNTEAAEIIKRVWKKAYQNAGIDEPSSYVTAYYDAWSHDNESDPIISILYAIMKEASYVAKPERTREWSRILGTVGDCITDRNISGLIEACKGKDIFEEQKADESLETVINKFFLSLLPEHGNKLIVFIDELDRCSPQYAIKVLERIKHYFNQENVIFIFSMNPEELQHTIKKNYGNEFSASKYLDRFFDIRVGLQPVDIEKYLFYLGLSGRTNIRETICKEVIRKMNFEMREISRFMPMTKIATYKVIDSEQAKNNDWTFGDNGLARIFCMGVIVPIAIGLKIHNGDEYLDFIEGRDSKWLKSILDTDELHSWMCDPLLFEDESFIEMSDKKIVTYEEKIEEVYFTIFKKSYEGTREYQTKLGKMIFTKEAKYNILAALSLMSKYSSYNI